MKILGKTISPRQVSSILGSRLIQRYYKFRWSLTSGQSRSDKRSTSDNGLYPELCLKASIEPGLFYNFRRNRLYTPILEHVTRQMGEKYLKWITDKGEPTEDLINTILLLNDIGNPALTDYQPVGQCSPTALRYAKVALEIQQLFPDCSDWRIAEIGGGYGGLCLVSDKLLKPKEYVIFDLPQVLSLVERFLECYLLNLTYHLKVISQYPSGSEPFNLTISNYAFSELPRSLQEKYLSKVIVPSKHGYMTMNTGLKGEKNRYSSDELLELLPGSRIIAEEPLTAPNNYIIVW